MLVGLFATLLEKPNAAKGFGRFPIFEKPVPMANFDPFQSKK